MRREFGALFECEDDARRCASRTHCVRWPRCARRILFTLEHAVSKGCARSRSSPLRKSCEPSGLCSRQRRFVRPGTCFRSFAQCGAGLRQLPRARRARMFSTERRTPVRRRVRHAGAPCRRRPSGRSPIESVLICREVPARVRFVEHPRRSKLAGGNSWFCAGAGIPARRIGWKCGTRDVVLPVSLLRRTAASATARVA